MNTEANPSEVIDLPSFILFVTTLQKELEEDIPKNLNFNTIDFLEGLSRYAEDIQGYYNNTGQNLDASIPTWRTFADLLKGASMYE
jgi:hypothetical protein